MRTGAVTVRGIGSDDGGGVETGKWSNLRAVGPRDGLDVRTWSAVRRLHGVLSTRARCSQDHVVGCP
jgi:hypothetical protein